MKEYFQMLVNVNVKKNCGKKRVRVKGRKDVVAYYTSFKGDLLFSVDPEETETIYGDSYQSWYSSAFVLHNFMICN